MTEEQQTAPELEVLEAFLQLSEKIEKDLDFLILKLASSRSIDDFFK